MSNPPYMRRGQRRRRSRFARVLFYWNTASEATRPARIVVAGDWGAGNIQSVMTSPLPVLASSNIRASCAPSGCDPDAATARSNCTSVTVSVANVSIRTLIPVVPLTLTLPPFTTTLSRESMASATGGPICN